VAAAAAALSVAPSVFAQSPPPVDRAQQYLGLAKATLERPITPAEMDAALLSPAGVEAIAALFAKSLEASMTVGGRRVIPEVGGEATLHEGRLRFTEYADRLHAIVRRMPELSADPKALLDFLSGSAEGLQVLSTAGGLHAHLHQMTTRPPTAEQRRVLDQVIASAITVVFKTWTVTPETQMEMIRDHDWEGRYVGFWHIHPPLRTAAGYGPGMEPSMEDMTIAVAEGQLLTLVYQPTGFDAYDLAPLAAAGTPDLSKARVVRYRSPEWERRFRALTR